MAGGKKNGLLTELDELFLTQEQRDKAKQEGVQDIPLSEISDFPNHPFQVLNDEAMQEMAASVKQVGVLVPAVVRPKEGGGYEMVAGHRRKMASELAGLPTMPCIVRDLTDDEAIIAMVDANLQREKILPSEKARAYKMKLDAIKRQGKRTDLTLSPVETKLRSSEVIAQGTGDSRAQVDRFIRLNNLIDPILSLVDEGRIGMRPAVELSYLPKEDQEKVYEAIDSEQNMPSLSQAQRMRKMSKAGELNDDTALSVMMEQKKPDNFRLVIDIDKIRGYFPKNYTADKMEETIVKLLAGWARQRTHDKGAR